MSSKAYFVKSTDGSVFPLSYQELPANAGSLGTDGDGNIIASSSSTNMIVNGTAEAFYDDTDSYIVAYNMIFELDSPVEVSKGNIIKIDVFGALDQINTSLINTTASVGYNTDNVTYGSIDLRHKDIILFIGDSSTNRGMTLTSRQSMIQIDNQSDISGITNSLNNLSWNFIYSEDVPSIDYSTIDSTNNIVTLNSNNKSKLIPFGINDRLHSMSVFNNNKINTKFDRISIGIFTGFAKMDIFASCSAWVGLTLQTFEVKARIEVK